MSLVEHEPEILFPVNQLRLFGYNKYFNIFDKMYQNESLPNVILLNGLKGSGKATFAYHFINYLLSVDEEDSYSKNNFTINSNNKSYKLLQDQTHPNFFLLDNIISESDIKVDQARSLIKYLNKSTYSKDLKIVMIDNAEYLNLNASNAILKALEEPPKNTFFFIIQNSSSPIIDTIKSRSIEFKIFFNTQEKKEIFEEISDANSLSFASNHINEAFSFDTPGNILKYVSMLESTNLDFTKDFSKCILHFLEMYRVKKNTEFLTYASLFVEKYYADLSLKNKKYLSHYDVSKNSILTLFNNTKKYNLDKKNLSFATKEILNQNA